MVWEQICCHSRVGISSAGVSVTEGESDVTEVKFGYNFILKFIFFMFMSYIYLQLFLGIPTVLQLHFLILLPCTSTGAQATVLFNCLM